MTSHIDLLKIAQEEQHGDLFKLLDTIYKRSSVKPAGYPTPSSGRAAIPPAA